VNSSSNNRKPKINFGILINEGIVQSITLQIPSRDYIRYQLLSLIFPKKIEYIENKIDNSNRLNFANLLGNKSEKLKEELSYEDYEKYKKSVDKYNEDLEDFFIEVEEYIFRFSSNKSINLILNNNGNIAASNPTVKLYYNTGQILMNEFFDLKKPKFSSEVPNINDFSTSSKYAIITSSLEPFQIPSLSLINSKEPFIEDTDYVYKIDKSRLGHNDNIIEEIELTRMNLEEMNFEIQYEINYDEEPETLSGFIKINYEYVETIGEELKKKVEDKLKDFKKILQR